MCIVINLDVVCLVCLHNSSQMHEISKPDNADADNIPIAQKISSLSELKTGDKNLPEKICDNCLIDLRSAWRFHKNCQTAQLVFQSILKPEHFSEPQGRIEESLDETLEVSKIETAPKEEEGEEENTVAANEHDFTSDADDQSNQTRSGGTQVRDELFEKESNNEFLELEQNIVEEEEVFQHIADSVDDDIEVVEYYLTDDAHEQQEETIVSTEKTPSVVIKRGESIASKKFVVETAKMFPKTSKIETTARQHQTQRSRGRTSHSQLHPIKRAIADARKTTNQTIQIEALDEKTIMEQAKRLEFSQHQEMSENETDLKTIRQVKARKRKTFSPDSKPPKICELCGNSYRFQHALNAHMRRHFQDKPFPCEVCDKAFVSNVELRRHMRVHTGHKPYACQYCERRFSDFGSRIKHERTHTGERPYSCSTCGKTFAYPHVLSVHMRIHTGEKKFQCTKCTKGFTKKAYLLSHMEQNHAPGRGRNSDFYPFNLEDEATTDTLDEHNDDLTTMKVVKFNDCIFNSEFVVNGLHTQHEEDEEHDDEDIILQGPILRPKVENEEGQEVLEVNLDEYTIRVR